MVADLPSGHLMEPPPEGTDMITGVRMLDEYKKWADEELGKIFLSARIIGVGVAYRPSAGAAQFGLKPQGEGDFSGTCQVHYEPLMGNLYFNCDLPTIEKNIRIPGINAEYRNYEVASERVDKEVCDENGMSVGYASSGHHKIWVGPFLDHCKI